jgi:type I restriction enzyme S subunit
MYGTAIPYIRLGNLQEFPIPIAPLAEQQRIVERIESLFAKLDEAKEKTQAALDSFETRKTAMLHNAFTGELTAKWRSEHSVSIENWGEKRLQNICHKITCGHTPTLDITECGEIPFLKVYNIVNNLVDFEYKPQYISRNIHNHNLSSSILYPGDVIMNIVGPPLRKIAIVPNTYPEWNMNQAIVRFRPKNELDNRFLYYSLLFPKTLDNVISKTKGVVGQANISITQSRNISIPVPTFAEQKEIVRILDDFFAKEQKAKELCSVLDNIDLIKKFILSRIFKGELGTNDPTEESAKELLMECLIQQTKENQEKKTKKTILIPIPKKVKAQLSNQIEHDIYSLLQKEGSCDLKKITAVRKNDLLVIDSVRTMAEKGIIKKQIDGCYCISELR